MAVSVQESNSGLDEWMHVKYQSWVLVGIYAIMVVSNVLAGLSVFNDTSNADISNANPTYLTPDGLTFSIWGIIYLFQGFLAVYQALPRAYNIQVLKTSRPWIGATFLMNSIWLPVFQYHRWWLSLGIIVGYLYCLYRTAKSMRIDYASKVHTVSTKFFVFPGISINFGWVVVATLVNLCVVFRQSNIMVTEIIGNNITDKTSGFVGANTAVVGANVDFAIFAGVAAVSYAMWRVSMYADWPYVTVTAWALGGIYRNQQSNNDSKFPIAAESDALKEWALVLLCIAGAGAVVGALLAFSGKKLSRSAEKNAEQPEHMDSLVKH